MDRRNFIGKTLAAGLLPMVPVSAISTELDLIKPKALPKNGTFSLVTPSSSVSRSSFEQTLENVAALGFKAKYSPNVRVRSGFLSGTDQQRIDDLHGAFMDPETDGILCVRGGYGSGRLLGALDYELIRKHPKPLIGYSDITALLHAIYKKTGLVGFHGPVGTSTFNDYTVDLMMEVLQKGKKIKIKNDENQPLFSGTATGKLIGGNLSLLCSLIGTPFDVDYQNHLLFIEEVGEATYRIDRMLTQLLNAGKLAGVKGIVLGSFKGCDTQGSDPSYEYSLSLDEVFNDRFAKLGIPVAKGFSFGHEEHNATLPIGIAAELDADNGVLKLLESAVTG